MTALRGLFEGQRTVAQETPSSVAFGATFPLEGEGYCGCPFRDSMKFWYIKSKGFFMSAELTEAFPSEREGYSGRFLCDSMNF